MNQKRPYRPETPTPAYDHEVTISVTGKNYRVTHGQEVTIESAPGYRQRSKRYRFEYAEPDGGLVFFGPVRAKGQKYRWLFPATLHLIRTVHVKTRE